MARIKLGDVAAEVRTTWSGETAGIPLVGLEHLVSGDILLKNWATDITDSTFTKAFKKGQVLLGRRRVYLKKAVLAPFAGICSGDITVIESDPKKLSPRLLPFIIQNDKFFDYAMQGSAGSLSPRVKWAHLAEYEFDLPSLEEQEHIAELLWAAYDLKESYKRLLAASDELARSRFVEMFGDPIKNPNGWKTSTLAEICSTIKGGGTPSKTHKEYYCGNIPWVTPKDMKSDRISDSIDHITPEAVEQSTTSLMDSYSVLMVIRSGILKHTLPVAINTVPVAINQDMKAFVPGKSINAPFLFAFFKAVEPDILSGVRAVTADNIEFKSLLSRSVIIPPLTLQNEFAAFVEQLDKSKFTLQKSIDSVDAILKKLLNETMKGEI